MNVIDLHTALQKQFKQNQRTICAKEKKEINRILESLNNYSKTIGDNSKAYNDYDFDIFYSFCPKFRKKGFKLPEKILKLEKIMRLKS